VRHKKWRKTNTSSEEKKLRKTHILNEAQKSGEKLIPQVRHKKVEKNSYLK
jgi:hypothetical protein